MTYWTNRAKAAQQGGMARASFLASVPSTADRYQASQAWPEAPDTQPGAYYVTAADITSNAGTVAAYWLMLGPFINDHASALACVDAVQAMCNKLDTTGRAWFMSYGTIRKPADDSVPLRAGKLNSYFGLPTERE